MTPEGAQIRNPAFDVTPAKYVTAIITERGIARPPYAESLASLVNAQPARTRTRTSNRPEPEHEREARTGSVNGMIMLGIETSCDETAAAIVEETGDAAAPGACARASSRRRWHSIANGAASSRNSPPASTFATSVVSSAARSLTRTSREFDAIAVTQGPGLVGSLLVGLSFAKSLAWARNVPLVPVHHLAGHIESLTLENGEMPLPAVVLVVSGGHTSLYRVATPGHYELLGRTRDDAAGEAYDKVAKLLGLGYPGGPVIDKRAARGDDRAVPFPKTRITHADRNAPEVPGRATSASADLKTSVLRHVTQRRAALGLDETEPLPD